MGDRQSIRAVDVGRIGDVAPAARKRAAVELIRRHERTLRRTARRYSLCADDAEDALQRALEILLTKAPTSDQRDLIRWTG
jgi:DNA-directed RNA polymerase specialized sigma24 family protein